MKVKRDIRKIIVKLELDAEDVKDLRDFAKYYQLSLDVYIRHVLRDSCDRMKKLPEHKGRK